MTKQINNTIKINAKGRILGRLAAEIANKLRGKDKTSFSFNKICGDKITVFNIKDIVLTGNKIEQKQYFRHTGYLGNLKTIAFKEIWQKDPSKILYMAVRGMLPKNRLQKLWLKNLTLVKGEISKKS